MKTILVIGATGNLGQAVARQLKNDGYHVRVFTRNHEKAVRIFNDDFEIHNGNVLDFDTLDKALEKSEGIYINLSGDALVQGVNNIVSKAREKDVGQIGFISGSSVRKENAWHPMIKANYESEEIIVNSGIAYSIFKPTMFLDTLPRYANKGKPFLIGNQPQKWSWIYSGDLAKMVSRAFSLEEARNKKFTIFGPDKATIPEAIKAFNKVFYPEVSKVKSMPYWMAGIMALFIGKKFRYVISLFRYFENHPEEGDPSEANRLLGKPQTGFKEYFEIYRPAEV